MCPLAAGHESMCAALRDVNPSPLVTKVSNPAFGHVEPLVGRKSDMIGCPFLLLWVTHSFYILPYWCNTNSVPLVSPQSELIPSPSPSLFVWPFLCLHLLSFYISTALCLLSDLFRRRFTSPLLHSTDLYSGYPSGDSVCSPFLGQ